MKQIDTPAWMLELFKAIDELDTSESSGFAILTDDIEMHFGPHKVDGIEAVKKFFTGLDGPYTTVHRVDEVYQVGDAMIMQGNATLKAKDNPDAETVQVAPLLNVFWLTSDGKVETYIVSFPPALARAAGMA